MPEYYSSIGEAVGAAMQHNIRLAHRSAPPRPDTSLKGRHLPSASADPHSIRGMIARLTEDATPDEVAGILEEVNDTLVGALSELSELVGAAADWTRVRLEFPLPVAHNHTWETWKRLAAAYDYLKDVRRELEAAEDGVAECPVEHGNPQHYAKVHTLRSRELLDDVFGADPVAAASSAPDTDHRRATPTSAPQAGSAEVPPRTSPSRSPEGSSMANLADTYGTDVEIYPWGDEIVWADCRTGLPESGHRVLRSFGFTAPGAPGDASCYNLPRGFPDPERKIAATLAANLLADLGYQVAIDPVLIDRSLDGNSDPEVRRQAAALQVSPVAAKTATETSVPAPATPPPPAARPAGRQR
ncbi:hypothetical protein ACIQD1_11385 [Streptomyces sp. NPDC093088]|uniref:hypothetical protein n=1 Tax=Streptomyces sp. NPDC093088 TaxID=3366023 RepID=UPI00382B200C